MIVWTKRLLLTISLLALIASNVLTLTSVAFNAALSGLVSSALGVRTVTGTLQSRIKAKDKVLYKHRSTALKRKTAARKFGSRLVTRTRRVAAKSIAALPVESVPFVGVAVLIADTGYELYAACETIHDLDRLYTDLGIPERVSDDALHAACNPALPDAGEVWEAVKGNVDQWWDDLLEAV